MSAIEEFEELPQRETAWQVLERITAYRKQLLAAGYWPIPVNGKIPRLDDWPNIRATEAMIDTWNQTRPDHINTSVLTFNTPFIDIDVTDEQVAENIEALLESVIDKSAVRVGKPPKRAVPFRTETPFKKMVAEFTAPNGSLQRVEILGVGQQIVVDGIHPDTRQPYRWHGGEPGPRLQREELPLLTPAAATAFLAAAADIMRGYGWTEVKDVKSNGAGKNVARPGGDVDPGRGRTYARSALDGCAEDLAATLPQKRNDVLNAKAFKLGRMVARGWLARAEVEPVLFEAAQACGLVKDDGEKQTRATIQSGLDAGEKNPHPGLNTQEQEHGGDSEKWEEPQPPEDPIPLFPPLPPAARFPVEALGKILSNAALAIACKVQGSVVIAAQSVLAAAALAAQAMANVMMPYGDTRPLSLFFITIAASGERKTTADNAVLWPIRKYEDALKEIYRAELMRWDVKQAAWKAERKKIEGDKKIDRFAREDALTRLGPEPLPPLQPFLTAAEPTIEGLIKAWVHAPAALGIFSAEGGQFIGGYGMSLDHRLKTAAAMSGMWDGAKTHRLRAGDGSIILEGRRLSVHLMVQPDAAAAFLSDPILRNQGLLSRILTAQPDSLSGSRPYRDTEEADLETIKRYSARILAILESPWPMAEGERNVLAPPALTLDAGAFMAWKEFYNGVENRCGQSGELATIVDFAAKAAEQAARIAGVLTVVDDRLAREIKAATMRDAVTIADWYVNETLRLQQGARTDPLLVRAQRLLEWLRARGGEIGLRDIITFGPASERSKAAAEETLAILRSHGWVREVSRRPYRIAVMGKAQ